ncbi:MAG: Rhodanese-like domain protein [uncultured Sulfurovum sp.]|uniref:Rhodanese-like domain protein n=1 Tax=uncultured Sulfurovum sp. TaxID=269237 RepID=A0A6S6TJT1_9BACT|nr:MAG: Rhodanese-like domain protein [uncultured Sulfurovum sp.]
MKKYTNILYWIVMFAIMIFFAYSKGWILANFQSVEAKQAIVMLENDTNTSLLDVRTIQEYKEGHLRDATLIPVEHLEQNLGMLKNEKNKKILVYCATGNRSVYASRVLEKHGFTPINIKGGIMDLAKENVEIVKSK